MREVTFARHKLYKETAVEGRGRNPQTSMAFLFHTLMQSSCIAHPTGEKFIIIRPWQIHFCNGNECAAALLSFFEYWHNWKVQDRDKNMARNKVAATGKDPEVFDTSLLQFHSTQDLESGLLIFKKDAIRKALQLLEDLAVIEVHANPNPKYAFDRTKFFLFKPDIVNNYLITTISGKPYMGIDAVSGKPHTVSDKPPTVDGKPTNNNIDNFQSSTSKEDVPVFTNVHTGGEINFDGQTEPKDTSGDQEPPVAPAPQGTGKKTTKAVKTKEPKEDDMNPDQKKLRTLMVDTYFAWHEDHVGVPPNWKGKEGGREGAGIKDLVRYLLPVFIKREKVATGITVDADLNMDNVIVAANDGWKHILQAFKGENLEVFYRKQTKASQIAANITNIINQMKNANDFNRTKPGANKQPATNANLHTSLSDRYSNG